MCLLPGVETEEIIRRMTLTFLSYASPALLSTGSFGCSADALRIIRYHAIDAQGEPVLDVTGIVRRIDADEQTCPMACLDETVCGCVVSKADVRSPVRDSTDDGVSGQSSEERHKRGIRGERSNLCQFVVQE